MKHTSRQTKWFETIMTLCVVVLIWEGAARVFISTPNPLPPPSVFLRDAMMNGMQIGIGSQATSVWTALAASLFRVIVGLVIAVVIGTPLGFAIARFPRVERWVLPIARLFAPIAPIAWVPIALAFFGIGNQTAIAVVVIGILFVFTLNVVAAVRSVKTSILDAARSLDARGITLYTQVLFPAILPDLINAIRMNFLGAWMAVLVAEMTGLRDGLGTIIMTGRNLFDYNLITLGMFFIAIIGVVFDLIAQYVKDKFFWWDKV